MKKYLIPFLFIIACNSPQNNEGNLRPDLNSVFSLAEDTNIEFKNQLTFNGDFNILEYLYYYNGGGVAAGDINNDGLTDLFFTGNEVSNKLYLNKGAMKFEDISEESGVAEQNFWSTGVTMADVNHDGWLDIYVCNLGSYLGQKGKNQLFINQKNGEFKEEATKFGLDFSGLSTQSAFFDYDMDGDLDLYLLNHSFHDVNSYANANTRRIPDKITGDKLYENLANEGEMTFKDVSRKSGIYSSHLGYGLGIGISDLNQDGWPDIYVSNDFHENDYLYINQQNGSFKEVGTKSFGHQTRFSMGNDLADLNNDGLIDVFTLDMLPSNHEILMKSAGEDKNRVSQIKKKYGYHEQYSRNAFQVNQGNNTFKDIAMMKEMYATDWSWSPLIADFNNDGFNDLYIANGIYKRPNDLDFINFKSSVDYRDYTKNRKDSVKQKIIDGMPSGRVSNVFFWGDSLGNFKREDFYEASYSNGAVYADLDNDGDLDLINNNINEKATILENNAQSNYLKIKINGPRFNRFGIGSKVAVYFDGKQSIKELYTSRGFQSSIAPLLTFGLGKASRVDSVVVFYRNKKQVFEQVPINQKFEIRLDVKAVKVDYLSDSANRREVLQLPFAHKEDVFYDYEKETLIPFGLSRKGPALAKADINNDGLEDLYFGGTHEQSGRILYQVQDSKGSRYVDGLHTVFKTESAYEDTDAVFEDIDGDEDLDLIVISGGSKYKSSNPLLKHRIYLNEGGDFKRDKSFFTFQSNGSCVRATDFDADGDIDLFIGTLSIVGQYGVGPLSYLLENDGKGKFTKKKVKGLTGMITDALWVDYDLDGDSDLVVVGLWMTPKLYRNDKNDFTLINDFFPPNLTGWWNSIETGDFDGDGRPDLVLGNFGENTLVKASEKEPISLFLDDFDNNGRLDPVIFRYFNHQQIPLFPKDNLAEQLPYLKKKFQRYEDYSKIKKPEELFGKPVRAMSVVTSLSSMVILNKKEGVSVKALPEAAQLSVINDILVKDINNDKIPDLMIAGNYETHISNFGKLDANAGSILIGDGKGGFRWEEDLPVPSFKVYNKIIPIEFSGEPYWLTAQNNGSLFLVKE